MLIRQLAALLLILEVTDKTAYLHKWGMQEHILSHCLGPLRKSKATERGFAMVCHWTMWLFTKFYCSLSFPFIIKQYEIHF